MDCPQWTAMSQRPASLPTTLPPKCHPTWGTAPPPRPMWPDPRGSRPVAVLYLPTAVTLPPLWPSRAWQPAATPSTRSPPRRCEVSSTRLSRGGEWEGVCVWGERDSEDRRHQVCPLWLRFIPTASFFYEGLGPQDQYSCPLSPTSQLLTQSHQRHARNKLSFFIFFFTTTNSRCLKELAG